MTTKEEYAERRERWAQALESGQYAQTKELLHNESGYCCLGVLCDIAGVKWERQEKRGEAYYTYDDNNMERGVSLLTRAMCEWIGLTTSDGRFGPKGSEEKLTDLNDQGKDFKEIAEIIRSAPEGLFVDGDA